MIETLDNFFERIYVNFIKDIVFIFSDKRRIGKPQKWNCEKARQYVNYLQENEFSPRKS